ncbi:MAG: hypothetical protein M3N41_13180 [Acidobacteriota bacterium]|nr:hypothetical protein [Acidobacteriota bacterium]
MKERTGRVLLACLLSSIMPLTAADNQAPQSSEIDQLKQLLADQQKQNNELRQALTQQQGTQQQASEATPAAVPVIPAADPTPVSTFRNLGEVASTTGLVPRPKSLPAAMALPALPAIPRPQTASAAGATAASKDPCEADPDKTIPTYLRLGNVCIIPVGFMDFTPFWRDKNAASSMGSNFGSVPYNNVANGNLSEFHFSQQNSRLGFRIDGDWKGTHFIGYNEFDFNGTSGSTSLAVSNGAIVPRLRLYWADVRKGKVEFLAGQSWSMLTPNRNGLSALPGDLFFTQVIDINYVAGLTWTRQPGLRVLIHPNKHVTFGFSAEQPDQYIGGSAGGSGITLPSALSGLASTQLDAAGNISGASYLAQPGYTPDLIAKLSIDLPRFHFEVGGIESNFKTTSVAAPFVSHTTQGAGVLAGFNVALLKNVRIMSSNFFSDGEGRYLFGQAPDVIVRADGSLSAVHAASTLDGVEARIMKNNLLLYAYYGGIYIGRNTALDANGTTRIGYGYTGSPNSQNRSINEFTFGFNQTMWASPRYGAINVMGQYEYLMREPWFVAAGAPKATHDNTIYFNIRYTLPGGMPNF